MLKIGFEPGPQQLTTKTPMLQSMRLTPTSSPPLVFNTAVPVNPLNIIIAYYDRSRKSPSIEKKSFEKSEFLIELR